MDSVPHQTLAEWVQAELAAREAEHTAYESLTRAKAGEATAANAPAPTDPAPATPSHEDLVNLGNCHITITTDLDTEGRSCFLVRPEVPRRYFEMEDYDDNGPEGDLNRWLVMIGESMILYDHFEIVKLMLVGNFEPVILRGQR